MSELEHLRQQARLADQLGDAASIAAWQRVHDQGAEAEEDNAPGH